MNLSDQPYSQPPLQLVQVPDNTQEYADYKANGYLPSTDDSDYNQASDDHETAMSAINDIKKSIAQSNIDQAQQLINQGLTQQQDPWGNARQNVNNAMDIYNNGEVHANNSHPILEGLLGTAAGAGLGYLLSSPLDKAMGLTGRNMALGGTMGGLLSVSDVDKAKNKYLNEKQAARKDFITKELGKISPENTINVANKSMEAQSSALKAQTPLDTAMFNHSVAQNYGYGNSFINPQTGQPYILNPTEQEAINNQLGKEEAQQSIVPQAEQSFNQHYGHKQPNQQQNNSQAVPLTGNISEQNQDRQFHIGTKPSDLKMVTDQYSKGTQDAISNQRMEHQQQHQKVMEQQGWVKTSEYGKNIDNMVKNRNVGTDIKKQALELKKVAAGMTDDQKDFAANYLELKSGTSPEINAKVNEALNSKKITKEDVATYKKNLTNSYLQKAQQQYMRSYGHDIEILFKGTNKSNNYSPISTPADFEPETDNNEE